MAQDKTRKADAAPDAPAPDAAPDAPAPTDWDGIAAFVAPDAGWPATVDAAGLTFTLQTAKTGAATGLPKGSAFYTSDPENGGLYGTVDARQTSADEAHRKADAAPVAAYSVLIVGGGPVMGPDGLTGTLSPRTSDRPGTPRLMAVCRCHNRAILSPVAAPVAAPTAPTA